MAMHEGLLCEFDLISLPEDKFISFHHVQRVISQFIAKRTVVSMNYFTH